MISSNDNNYHPKPGTYRALVDGFSVVLKPPRPSTHDVRLKVSVLNSIKADIIMIQTGDIIL